MENENSEELSAAASSAAARRRRILENTNKRLGKITGRVHDEEIPNIEQDIVNNGIYPDPELERDTFEANTPLVSNGGLPNQDVFELLKSLQENRTNASSTSQQQQQTVPETPFSRLIKSRILIVTIALLVYSLHALHLERFIGNSVFGALVVWEMLEFFMTSFIIKEPAPPQNQIFALLAMFLGINPARIQLIMRLFGLFNKILRDIAIFLFTFVLLHLIYCFGYRGESLNEILDKDFTTMFSSLKNDEL